MASSAICVNLIAGFAGSKLAAAKRSSRAGTCRQSVMTTKAAFVSSGVNTSDLKAAGGRSVVELNGTKILIQAFMDDVYAVANKCPHLGLSMQGKTPLLSAEVRDDGCIVCPAHKSAFKLTTGEPVGEWCPSLPTLPFVGKPLEGTPTKIPVFAVQVTESGDIQLDV